MSFDCHSDDNQIIDSYIGTILDVSEGGLLLESDAIIDSNYLKLVIVGFDNHLYSVIGSAENSKSTANGKNRTEICFHGRSQESTNFVAAVIRTYFYNRNSPN